MLQHERLLVLLELVIDLLKWPRAQVGPHGVALQQQMDLELATRMTTQAEEQKLFQEAVLSRLATQETRYAEREKQFNARVRALAKKCQSHFVKTVSSIMFSGPCVAGLEPLGLLAPYCE